jgi:HEPN domain-containing protein
MDAAEKYEYWLEIAQYDLDTAEAMLNSRRWFYVVFMCQQAVEKLVKGLYILFIDLNGRYAVYKQKLSDRLDEQTAKDYLTLTKEAFAWLLTMKP